VAGKKRWEEGSIVDGVCETRFLSARNFFLYVQQEMLDLREYIWRGQRCDNWSLDSTLDRLLEKSQIPVKERRSFRAEHLRQFRLAARGRRGPNPPAINEDNEAWALGQHNGLCTPLLDWTKSPFVAAYFAFIGQGTTQTEFRTIYALHVPSVEFISQRIQTEAERELRELHPETGQLGVITWKDLARPRPEVEFITPPSDENQRLVNQSGLFTRAPDGLNIDQWVQTRFKGASTDQILRKLLVPNSDRSDSLKVLNRMNINHLTLFPDLYGASRYCNLYAEIEKY
jgi:FRG domain